MGPIFVGGDHRSGTTLVAVVLDSHPDLTVGPELDFLEPHSLGEHVVECCELLERGDPRVAGRGVDTHDPRYQLGVQFVRQCHRFGVEHAEVRATAEETLAALGRDLVGFDERCALIDRIGELGRAQTGTRHWGIKIQRSIARADEFVRVWPCARFVHVVRDGRDVAASQLRGDRGWGYHDVAEAAAGWLEVVAAPALGERFVYTLRYEELVAEPRETLESLISWLELPWSDALLAHQVTEHSLLQNPYEHPSAEEVARPIYSSAIGRYRRDLSAEEIAAFEELAAPELERLGYPLGAVARGWSAA